MADVIEELALLNDTEVQQVLNRVIEGYKIRNPDIPVNDPQALTQILTKVGETLNEPVKPLADSKVPNVAGAQRNILVQLARTPAGRELVEGAIANSRKTLLDPITIALVMAGIVLLLETEVNLKVSRKNGKTDFDVEVKKKPTDKSIIKKFFSLFS